MYGRLAPHLLGTLSIMLPLFTLAASIEEVDDKGVGSDAHTQYALKLDELHLVAKGEPIALAGKRSVQRMSQTYRGISIYGHGVAIERDAQGQVIHASGRYLQGIEHDLPHVEPALDANQAVEALQEQWRIKKGETSKAPTFTSTKLFIYQPRHESKARLIYRVSYSTDAKTKTGIPSNPTGLIDAATGEVLKSWEGVASLETRPAYGPGGNVLIGEYRYGNERPTLPSTQRGRACSFDHNGIQIFYGTIQVPSPPWIFPCPFSVQETINGGYTPVNDLYFHTIITRDLYLDILGVQPIIGGLKMLFLTAKGDGAGWSTTENMGVFLSGATSFHPMVSQDIVAHEISHGFSLQNSGLEDSSAQEGGINEAFSDMSGEAAKYRRNGKSDFVIASSITKPDGDYGYLGGLRQMCHQSTDGHSIEHASEFDVNGMDAHYSSGVYNKAYCLLSKTPSWDQRKAFQVFALANHSYWSQDETFDTAACGAEQAARALGHPVADLQKALAEVGVQCAKGSPIG
jgi:Zn-dependent metalloprotease